MSHVYARHVVTLGFVLVSIALISHTPARVATECTCPKVPASGVGNSSCSASEDNGKCTVDFNIFFEREIRAIALLKQADVAVAAPTPSANSTAALAELKGRPNQLTDAIIIYLTVALSAQPNASALTKVVGRIANTVRSPPVSSRLATAFDPNSGGGLPSSDNPPFDTFEGNRFRIVRGCIELFADDTWVMFKTNWSTYAATPRCGGER